MLRAERRRSAGARRNATTRQASGERNALAAYEDVGAAPGPWLFCTALYGRELIPTVRVFSPSRRTRWSRARRNRCWWRRAASTMATTQRIAGGFAAPVDFAALQAELTNAICRAQSAEGREMLRVWEIGNELEQTRKALRKALEAKASATQSCDEAGALMLKHRESAQRGMPVSKDHWRRLWRRPTLTSAVRPPPATDAIFQPSSSQTVGPTVPPFQWTGGPTTRAMRTRSAICTTSSQHRNRRSLPQRGLLCTLLCAFDVLTVCVLCAHCASRCALTVRLAGDRVAAKAAGAAAEPGGALLCTPSPPRTLPCTPSHPHTALAAAFHPPFTTPYRNTATNSSGARTRRRARGIIGSYDL